MVPRNINTIIVVRYRHNVMDELFISPRGVYCQ